MGEFSHTALMESRLLKTQHYRSLASLLDNLSDLLHDWIGIVSGEHRTGTEQEEFQKLLEQLRSFEVVSPQKKETKQEEKNTDQFMDELAALSSLELPEFSAESAMAALSDLESFSGPSNPSSNDLSSLTLPENFDNFFVSPVVKQKKTRRVGGLGRHGGRITKKNFSGIDPSMFKAPASEPTQSTPATDNISDSFGLSSLDELTAALQLNSATIESPKTPSRSQAHTPMAYDDFFKGLNTASEVANESVEISPRGDKLIRAYGVRDDMNRRGMQKVKKKSQLNAHGRGVYQMEDTNYVEVPFDNNNDRALFCVFDGHVDKNAAIAATSIFPEELKKHLPTREIGYDAGEYLRSTFLSTDERMRQYDMEGATATSVLFWREEGVRYVQTANVGDSSAFLCRNGKAIMLSFDHKVNEASERARLLEAGLELNEGATRINGLAVSRALGDHFIKDNFKGVTAEPYLSEPFVIQDGNDSILIVASDGLWDTMSGQDAMDAIKKSKDPKAMSSTLVNMALSSGLCNDNITVIVVLID